MSLKEKLFGRRPDSRFNEIAAEEREKHFQELRSEQARKKGREQAEWEAGGGLFGALGRGLQSTGKSGGKYAKKKLVKYARTIKKEKKPRYDISRALMPMSAGAGYGTQPNFDNVLPDFMQKKKRR